MWLKLLKKLMLCLSPRRLRKCACAVLETIKIVSVSATFIQLILPMYLGNVIKPNGETSFSEMIHIWTAKHQNHHWDNFIPYSKAYFWYYILKRGPHVLNAARVFITKCATNVQAHQGIRISGSGRTEIGAEVHRVSYSVCTRCYSLCAEKTDEWNWGAILLPLPNMNIYYPIVLTVHYIAEHNFVCNKQPPCPLIC
jgi:hypothetical protein